MVKTAQKADDPKAMTAAFAHVARQVFDNTAALRLVLRVAAAVDAEAAVLQDSIEEQRRVGQARVARALADKRFLAPSLKVGDARATSSTHLCRSTRIGFCDSNRAGPAHATRSGSPMRSTSCSSCPTSEPLPQASHDELVRALAPRRQSNTESLPPDPLQDADPSTRTGDRTTAEPHERHSSRPAAAHASVSGAAIPAVMQYERGQLQRWGRRR